jgi:hypothetical protein
MPKPCFDIGWKRGCNLQKIRQNRHDRENAMKREISGWQRLEHLADVREKRGKRGWKL